MSTFIVSDKTISTIVSYLKNQLITNDYTASMIRDNLYLAGLKLDLIKNESCENLCKMMMNINIQSYNYVYSKDFPDYYKFNFEHLNVKDYRALKYIDCWLYQSNEGDFDKTTVYVFFKEIRQIIANKIIAESEEYNKETLGEQ